MKAFAKSLALLLVLLMAVLLAGCGTQKNEPTTAETISETITTTEEVIVQEETEPTKQHTTEATSTIATPVKLTEINQEFLDLYLRNLHVYSDPSLIEVVGVRTWDFQDEPFFVVTTSFTNYLGERVKSAYRINRDTGIISPIRILLDYNSPEFDLPAINAAL